MKALCIDMDYYLYPKGVDNFDQFLTFLNDNYGKFVEITKVKDTGTVPPFFKNENKERTFLNVSAISDVTEAEIELLDENDYKISLENAIDEICQHCSNFDAGTGNCEIGEISENLCLNGKCECFDL